MLLPKCLSYCHYAVLWKHQGTYCAFLLSCSTIMTDDMWEKKKLQLWLEASMLFFEQKAKPAVKMRNKGTLIIHFQGMWRKKKPLLTFRWKKGGGKTDGRFIPKRSLASVVECRTGGLRWDNCDHETGDVWSQRDDVMSKFWTQDKGVEGWKLSNYLPRKPYKSPNLPKIVGPLVETRKTRKKGNRLLLGIHPFDSLMEYWTG